MAPRLSHAFFRFYGELNDFLPPAKRGKTVVLSFTVSGSVKDRIESAGPPHTEVELILANGSSVGFEYPVQDGDRIAVYPPFRQLDVAFVSRVRPPGPAPYRFVLDIHLGRLAAYLRMLGFDSVYRNDFEDDELAQISSQEKRILLTRDHGLLKRSCVVYGYFLRETTARRQLVEIVRRFGLQSSIAPFRRCIRCNSVLEAAGKETVRGRVPGPVSCRHEEFRACAGCGRIYWKGSHYERMVEFIEQIVKKPPGRDE